MYPPECLDTQHAIYYMPIFYNVMPKYAKYGTHHMAYGIWHMAWYMWYVGCPDTQWDVSIQPVKSRPKFDCRNKSYVSHIPLYFTTLAKEQKNVVCIPTNWKIKTISISV